MVLTREVEFEKGYDCGGPNGCAFGQSTCAPGKGGYHGMHGANMRFLLKGAFGTVDFVVYTNWYAKDTVERIENDKKRWVPRGSGSFDVGHLASLFFGPMPADLGYHALDVSESRKEWMQPRDNCPYLDGKPCYYDGSGLNAEPVFELLVTQGSEAVWDYLHDYYVDVLMLEE